jgi:hypothetical protein
MTQAERFLAAQRVGYKGGFSSAEVRKILRETAEAEKESK